MRTSLFIFALTGALAGAGCGSNRAVTRTASDEAIDLSGKWNDTDSRLVAEEMVQDCTARPWLENFKANNAGKIPDVVVGSVRNKSYEHIQTDTFVNDLTRALTNSGRVSFVARWRAVFGCNASVRSTSSPSSTPRSR